MHKEDGNYTDEIVVSWDEYDELVKKMCVKIKEDHPDLTDIGIVGIARGGLTILSSVSYTLDTKNIGVVHFTFNDENGIYDPHNEARVYGEFYNPNIKNYIIVEDVLVTGKTIEVAAERLESNGKNLLDVYSFYLVDDYKNEYLEKKGLKAKPIYENPRSTWIAFPWDKRL